MLKKGFTLIELLIGIGIFAAVMATVNVFLYTAFRNARKAAAIGIASTEGTYTIRAIEQMVKYAKAISCNSSHTRLTVTRLNNDVFDYRFDTATNPDRVASVSANTVGLTSNKVAVRACSNGMFNCDSENKSVRVCFMVESATATDVQTSVGSYGSGGVTFDTIITLRNWGI